MRRDRQGLGHVGLARAACAGECSSRQLPGGASHAKQQIAVAIEFFNRGGERIHIRVPRAPIRAFKVGLDHDFWMVDAAGNRSKPARVGFKVVRG